MYKQKLVLVGNGMAGIRCIEEILKYAPALFNITVIGSEPYVNYNRVQLSAVLQGNHSFEDIVLNDNGWYEKNDIQLFTGETVVKINKERKNVKTNKNKVVPYDKLIIATGSVPFLLPIPGIDKKGVVSFRTIEDCQNLIQESKQHKKAVIVGGGLLGLEAARGLHNLCMDVKVVHNSSYIMERQLDPVAAKMLKKELENQGMKFLLEKETKEVTGNDRATGLRFTDGTEIDADLIVMAAGVRPNVQLARDSGVETNKAILVNDYLETNVQDIFAVGECAEHRGFVYGLVKPLYEQGQILAKHICGLETPGYRGSVLSTQLKISGVNVFSTGRFTEDAEAKSITVHDELRGIYKKIVFQGKRMVGAILFGDTSAASKILKLIIERKEVTETEQEAFYQSTADSNRTATSMGVNEMICNCNSVSKGDIMEAVLQDGLTTVEQVKKCTKATGSCGSCKPIVTELLNYIKSASFNEMLKRKPLCSCTNITEDEVIKEIQLRNLYSVQETMDVLNWNKPEGCSICSGALNYYLGMIHPDYKDLTIKHINAERLRDGTFSIVPQMYGGMTNVEQLKKIAYVAEKYRIPFITLTSNQRIQLMGIKKDILDQVCTELNMTLSPQHGHTIQSVESEIGKVFCQCERISSLHLAASLEKRFEFINNPQSISMAVSPCIHNGEETKTKDIALIGIDWGWEIHVGGSSGHSGELLFVSETSEEALEIVTGFVQYYRETASYLEGTGHWIERLGLIHIREVLFDSEFRNQLNKRLEQDSVRYKKYINC